VVLVGMACALMADAEQVDVEAGKLIDLGPGSTHVSHASPGTVSDSKMLSHYVTCEDPSCKTMNFGPVRNLQKGDDKAAEEEAMIAKSAEPELRRKDQAAMPNEGEPIVGEEQLKTLRSTKYPVASSTSKCMEWTVTRRRYCTQYLQYTRRRYCRENPAREAVYSNQRRRYCLKYNYAPRRTCPAGSSPIFNRMECEDAYRLQAPTGVTKIPGIQDTSNIYMGRGCIIYKYQVWLRRRGVPGNTWATSGYGVPEASSLRRRRYWWRRRRSVWMAGNFMNSAVPPADKSAYTYIGAQMVCQDDAPPTAAPTAPAPFVAPPAPALI